MLVFILFLRVIPVYDGFYFLACGDGPNLGFRIHVRRRLNLSPFGP